ncbi:hypothetical protein QD460_28640 [Rhizobium jaguaris]|uniref:hypothetical protein n=1 Tax=Rhizobium jaguaris TaxID=1312183 RepID=UPI0039BFC55F
MRVLLVPFAAAALFATATYSSATPTDNAAATSNVIYTEAGHRLPVDMKVPALTAGIKVQVSWSQTQSAPQQVRIIR